MTTTEKILLLGMILIAMVHIPWYFAYDELQFDKETAELKLAKCGQEMVDRYQRCEATASNLARTERDLGKCYAALAATALPPTGEPHESPDPPLPPK